MHMREAANGPRQSVDDAASAVEQQQNVKERANYPRLPSTSPCPPLSELIVPLECGEEV